MSKRLLVPALLLVGCTGNTPSQDPPSDDPNPGDEDPGQVTPPDDTQPDATPPVDDGYIPKPLTAARFGVFYQISADVLDVYQDPTHGLPQLDNHAWLITHSHATAFASKMLADRIHVRSDFYYAPAFDIWDASHAGWKTATDATLRQMAHDFRDAAIAGHADLFTFNESPSDTGTNPVTRVQIAKIIRFIHEPDAKGRQLWGVFYLTEAAATVSKYDSPAPDFFRAIDETSIAMVAEHYHSNGYVCGMSEAALANHYFAFRTWLLADGDPAKVSIANRKYTVLHSSRFDDGPSGWSGGDATQTTLANYQRALSRISKVTRQTDGGLNRLSFGPTATSLTQIGVHPRITALFRWHYLHTAAMDAELPCIANDGGNCTCN